MADSKKIGPVEAQLRALRERQFEERQRKAAASNPTRRKPSVAPAKRVEVAREALAAVSTGFVVDKPSVDSVDKTDRKAYQRELMRKKRAAKAKSV